MPGTEDRFDGDNCFIITNPSRQRLHLYGNNPDEIRISDIANAISKQCRFTGHLIGDAWYSVAEHCLLVMDILKHLGEPPEVQFMGLMHDTPEYGLSDIAAPFKREIGQYYEKEELLWKRIAAKYGMPEKLPEVVKRADWLALWIEARAIVAPEEEICQWVGYDKGGEESKTIPLQIFCLNHVQARHAWLDSFLRLRGV